MASWPKYRSSQLYRQTQKESNSFTWQHDLRTLSIKSYKLHMVERGNSIEASFSFSPRKTKSQKVLKNTIPFGHCYRNPLETHVSVALCLSSLVNLPYTVSKGAKIRNRYNQVPHLTLVCFVAFRPSQQLWSCRDGTTPDPGYQWESNKLTVRHHKREARGQVTTRHI